MQYVNTGVNEVCIQGGWNYFLMSYSYHDKLDRSCQKSAMKHSILKEREPYNQNRMQNKIEKNAIIHSFQSYFALHV